MIACCVHVLDKVFKGSFYMESSVGTKSSPKSTLEKRVKIFDTRSNLRARTLFSARETSDKKDARDRLGWSISDDAHI